MDAAGAAQRSRGSPGSVQDAYWNNRVYAPSTAIAVPSLPAVTNGRADTTHCKKRPRGRRPGRGPIAVRQRPQLATCPHPSCALTRGGAAGGGRQRGRGKGFRGKGGRKGRRGGKAASALQMEVGFKALEAEYVIDWLEELQVALAECR